MALNIHMQSSAMDGDHSLSQEVFTITYGDHRMLTVVTDSHLLLKKWLEELAKPSDAVVGIATDQNVVLRNSGPLDLIALSNSNTCLIYFLPRSEEKNMKAFRFTLKRFNTFFEKRNVLTLAVEAEKVARSLASNHGIVTHGLLDAGDVPRDGQRIVAQQALASIGVDALLPLVFGANTSVVRPVRDHDYLTVADESYPKLTDDRISFITLDATLLCLFGRQNQAESVAAAARLRELEDEE